MNRTVHLYDCDKTRFPNLALLKLSAWHKSKGDDVFWNAPLFPANKNYSSRVFSWSDSPPPGDYDMGGWVDSKKTLPDEIEHTCPDYEGLDYSLGFLSRGCIRKCLFCIVPEKEGEIRPHSEPQEFIRHKKAVFMDNNWLASPRWVSDFEWLSQNQIAVDFNQGLDARLVDEGVAKRLAGLRWGRCVRFACDSKTMKNPLAKAVRLLRAAGYKGEVFVYVLVVDIDDAYDRVEFCRGLGCDPFAQPYRDFSGRISGEARNFARWVNHKAIFKTVSWENYRGAA